MLNVVPHVCLCGLYRVVRSGVDINTVDLEGRSPLHFAATEGSVACARVLLSSGAIKEVQDIFGHTPADNARALGNVETAEFIDQFEIVAE